MSDDEKSVPTDNEANKASQNEKSASAANGGAPEAFAAATNKLEEVIARVEETFKTAKAAIAQPKRKRTRKMLTHGVYSDDHVTPWENRAELDKLYEEFKQDWQPEGRSQEESVFDLTNLTWLKRRAQKMPQLKYQRHPSAWEKVQHLPWPAIVQYNQMKGTAVMDALYATTSMTNALKTTLEGLGKIRPDLNTPFGQEAKEEIYKIRHRVTQNLDILEKTIPEIRSASKIAEESINTFDLAYDPDELSKQVRTEAAIQARIDKIINRLIWLKEYKRTTASRTNALPRVKSPTIAASPAANAASESSETADPVPASDDTTEE